MNSRLCPIVFNGFIKPEILEQLIEYVDSMAKKKLKAGLYHLFNFISIKLKLCFIILLANIVWLASCKDFLVKLISIISYADNSSSINRTQNWWFISNFQTVGSFKDLPINNKIYRYVIYIKASDTFQLLQRSLNLTKYIYLHASSPKTNRRTNKIYT